MKNYFFIFLLFAVAFEVVADILFKKWSLQSRNIFLGLGMISYTIGTGIWAYSLKFESLTRATTIFTILNLIAISLAGYFLFKEDLSLVNKIGFLVGIIAIILIEL